MKKTITLLALTILTSSAQAATVWCGYNTINGEAVVNVHYGDKVETVEFGTKYDDRNKAFAACESALSSATQCHSVYEEGTPSHREDGAVVLEVPARTVFVTPLDSHVHSSLDECRAKEALVNAENVKSQLTRERRAAFVNSLFARPGVNYRRDAGGY